jgi:hypothetical protein
VKYSVLAAAAAALIAVGCSNDDPAGPGASTEPGNGVAVTMKGILVGATFSGDIEITIGATGTTSFPVTGCLYLGSATCVTLTGTYTLGTKTITYTSASPSITFTGTYNGGEIHGSFSGADSGEFVLIDGSAVTFCGTFDGDANGTWNFVVEGTGLDGVYDDGSGPEDLSGSVNGNAFSITFSGGTASGTRNGTSASGTWSAAGGANTGTWTGSSSGCRS